MIGKLQLTALALAWLSTQPIASAAASPEALKFFENKVRPILVKNCQECHGEKKHKGGLRLDNLAYILQGGEQGPGLVPHQPDKSLLMHAVLYTDKEMEMPPDGKLPEADIATLRQWITLGAPWPEAEVAGAKLGRKPGQITDEDRQWWSFKPLQTKDFGVQMAAGDGVRNPIDAFVQKKLMENQLQPSPEATPTELIRRLYFDLTGLPPSPAEVTQFLADCAAESQSGKRKTENGKSPSAYERLVDRLLASPRYGERWAQHWLDLVRYAESEGYRQDAYRPNVWPYRDYVISSFNDDKPYAQFVREQLAGDEIAPDDTSVTVATGFLRHTIYEYNQRDAETQWQNILNEVTDVTADVFLGMSVQCAHCHDHKFDPILQKDYYRLQAFFGNITWPENKLLASAEQQREYAAKMAAYREAAKEPLAVIDDIIEPRIAKAEKSAIEKFPDEVQVMFAKAPSARTPWEEQVVQLALRQMDYERVRYKPEKLKEPMLSQLAEAKEQLKLFDTLKPEPLLPAFVIGETGTVGATTKFKTRKLGEVQVQPGFLTILDPTDAKIPEPSGNATTTGRRTVLANWLTNPDNPVTWRVIVNRVWQYHFGKGIAGNASDFGHLGEKPTHPELLDWLTGEFLRNGGRFKPLQKMIVMSATYRQSATIAASKAAPSSQPLAISQLTTDPENRLLWRFPPRRLDAEQARDAVLAASGELLTRMGGEGEAGTKPVRSIYTKKIRNSVDDFLSSLDMPAGFQSIPERQSTTTATQSLLLINGEWPLDRARVMANSLLTGKPKNDAELVRLAYQRTFARAPSADELGAATGFLKAQRAQLLRDAPPPPPPAPALASASPYFGPTSAAKTSKALMLKPGTGNEKLRVSTSGKLEAEQFAVEAVVYLTSLYPDAAVRTIASRWNNSKTEAGWAFGVTGEKSAHKPNNLIMQLSGEDFQDSPLYEAVPSGLRIPLNKPYYVAASIDNHPPEGQTLGGSVTFYARDLSDPSAPMQSATVHTQVCDSYINPTRALYVGGRDVDKRSLWDGAIARVAIRNGSLEGGKLMAWVGASEATCIADVNADLAATMLKALPAQAWSWETSTSLTKGKRPADPSKEAVADFCHALFNSNEFFYLQ